MTTPIERAVQTLQEVVLTGRRVLTHVQAEDATHAVFNSIDVDELARVLLDVLDVWFDPGDRLDALELAQAVIEWLTTGEKLGGPERQLGPTRIERKHQ